MDKQEFTDNYLFNQINWLRQCSLNLAALYLIVLMVFDYYRFPPEAFLETYTIRFTLMVLPLLVVIGHFYFQKKLHLSRKFLTVITFFGVTIIGFGHAEIIYLAAKYEFFFPKIGITIILIYAGLILAMPIKYAILSSICIIVYTSYTYAIIGLELKHVLSYMAFYTLFSSCCILSNFACIRILQSNLELMNKTNLMAITDDLTGLYNRRYFYSDSNQIYNQSIRDGKPLALILIDLDDFKAINDNLGHTYGDKILKEFSTILVENCKRPFDQVSRLGGDEFVIILYDSDIQYVKKVCQNILDRVKTLSETIHKENASINFSASIGVAENKLGDSYPLAFLLELADKSLYKVKQSGKNNYLISTNESYLESPLVANRL